MSANFNSILLMLSLFILSSWKLVWF